MTTKPQPSRVKEQEERRKAVEAKKRKWVKAQPEEERLRIRQFTSTLINTAEQHGGKVTAAGISAFLTEYTHNRSPRGGFYKREGTAAINEKK